MKKNMFKLLIIICMLFLAVGCDKKVEHDEGDFKITLNSGYKKRISDTFKYYYQDSTNIITVVREEIEDLGDIKITNESSAEEYLTEAMKVNNKEGNIINEKNYSYVEYESSNHYHVAAVFKSADSFWTINFMCLKDDKNKHKDQFINYIKSIEV